MINDFVFRPYKPSDRTALTQLIRKVWYFDRFASAKISERMAELFLNSFLANQTYTCVAKRDGQPLGVIMAKNANLFHRTLKPYLRFLRSLIAVVCNSEGRKVLRFFRNLSLIDKALRADGNNIYDSEITFFAINENARGQGLGRHLFTYTADALHVEGVHNCVLVTDTSRNYGFYEHLGLRCRSAHTHTMTIGDERITTTFFLYDFHP